MKKNTFDSFGCSPGRSGKDTICTFFEDTTYINNFIYISCLKNIYEIQKGVKCRLKIRQFYHPEISN